MHEPIISISGLRGIIGESLTPGIALHYVAAFSEALPPGPIVLSRDSRPSGRMLGEVIRATLVALGRHVIDAGIIPTPTVGVLIRELRAAGGVQISASHNPAAYNGLKLFSGEGRVIPAAIGEKVLTLYAERAGRWVHHDRLGKAEDAANPLAKHLELVLSRVNEERIRAQKFRVLLDVNHGAGGELGLKLLERLGCKVTVLGQEPTGLFLHGAEPTGENLQGVAQTVAAVEAQLGFCLDPDSDRLAVIDERGHYLGEEYTLALCLEHVLRKSPGAVVINCATSRLNEDIAERHGSTVTRSAVGEVNVVDEMLRRKATFGGEGNGGPIDPQVGLVRDAFVGMALILDLMASRNLPLSAIAGKLPHYEILKTKVTLAREEIPAALKALVDHFPSARPDWQDGLRLTWPDRWLLVRASNTEPIVRIIAEARTRELVHALAAEAEQVVDKKK